MKVQVEFIKVKKEMALVLWIKYLQYHKFIVTRQPTTSPNTIELKKEFVELTKKKQDFNHSNLENKSDY